MTQNVKVPEIFCLEDNNLMEIESQDQKSNERWEIHYECNCGCFAKVLLEQNGEYHKYMYNSKKEMVNYEVGNVNED